MSDDKSQITDVLQGYRNALVASSTSDVIKLYHPDSLLLAQGFPIVSGIDDIKVWYDNCFKLITLDVTFDIKEIEVMNENTAFATTTSAGTQKVNETGKVTQEGNNELLLLERTRASGRSGDTASPPLNRKV